MSGPIPTKTIAQLTDYGAPLNGNELFELWVVNTSRRVVSRKFVLPTDSLLTLVGQGADLPGSRQLVSSPTVQVIDNGAGNTVQLGTIGAGALPADPTAQIGLTVVNGVAPTWMRSDAAPPLDTTISPTWLGVHTFSQPITISQGSPAYRLNETDAAANNRLWDQIAIGEQLSFRAVNDAGTVATPWVAVDRTGTTIDTVNLQAITVQVNGVNVRDATNLFNTGTVPAARLPSSFSGLANPTASIGLAAVNGAATTAMRSDAAPPLSQTISPTWTNQHTFTTVFGNLSYPILMTSGAPGVGWQESDAAADNRLWELVVSSEQMLFRVKNDTGLTAVSWMAVDRTGTTIDNVSISTPLLRVPGIHNGTSPTGTTPAVASGTFTPTLTSITNINVSTPGSAETCQWIRVGNVVTVSGRISAIGAGAAGFCTVEMTIPIASDLTVASQLCGAAAADTTAVNAATLRGNTTNDRVSMTWNATSTSTANFTYTYTYLVQ